MFEETNKYIVILSILSILFIAILLHRYVMEYGNGRVKESFIQEPPFIVKRNEHTYDEFSSKIYDKIFHPEKEPYYIIENAFLLTEPSPAYTTILDVGCGTGELLHALNEKGFSTTYGLEKSAAMAKECVYKYPSMKIKVGDATQPTTFDKSTFTHIFCVGMTIYEFKDKIAFFRNCYYWLKPNSYLILHLVNREKFNTIVPAGERPALLLETDVKNSNILPQQYSQTRIVNTEVDFTDFKYKSSYDFSKKDVVVFTETFLDGATSKVRKNERELHMSDNMENILYDAQYCGFIVVGQINYGDLNGDENQYIFILERPN
jgi:SAM-dependent methyltransferase